VTQRYVRGKAITLRRDPPPQRQLALGHAHKWRIEEPNGPTSQGRCCFCGEVKEFRNGTEEVPAGSWVELASYSYHRRLG
jgi:hypothetical protein